MMSLKASDIKKTGFWEYKVLIPNILSQKSEMYPYTLMMPGFTTGLAELKDKWTVQMVYNDTNQVIEELHGPITRPFRIQLKLFESSYKFRAKTCISLCTCDNEFSNVLHGKFFVPVSTGAITSSINVDLDMIKQHHSCYGKLTCLYIGIIIGDCYMDSIKMGTAKKLRLTEGTRTLLENEVVPTIIGIKYLDICQEFILEVFQMDFWTNKSPYLHILYCKLIEEKNDTSDKLYKRIYGIFPNDFVQLKTLECTNSIYTERLHDKLRVLLVANLFQFANAKIFMENDIIEYLSMDMYQEKDEQLLFFIYMAEYFNASTFKKYIMEYAKKNIRRLLKDTNWRTRMNIYLQDKKEIASIIFKHCGFNDDQINALYM